MKGQQAMGEFELVEVTNTYCQARVFPIGMGRCWTTLRACRANGAWRMKGAMMNTHQVNALIASSYNLHVGPKERGEAMTPAKTTKLPRGDRAMLCKILRDKGGSDLYSQEQAAQALCFVLEQQ